MIGRAISTLVMLATCSRTPPAQDHVKQTREAGAMSGDPAPASGCTASPELQAVLAREPLSSFILPQGSGRAALATLRTTPDALHAAGLDGACPNPVRLAALEAWIALAGEGVLQKLDDTTATAIATVQAEALRTTDDAGIWGLPPDVVQSEVSRHLIIVGRRALPQLRPLLDDLRLLPYAGSEISAVASLKKYRVADLAAGLLAVILGAPYQDDRAPTVRDAQLADLRTRS